jgi:ApbE superfamily uncharacterized protein (UPF0280 family)
MQRHHFEYKDTIVTVICDPRFFGVADRSLRRSRALLEDYILTDPVFRETHDPHVPLPGACSLAGRMADETAKAGVGPMAAVAGAFAEACLLDMVHEGAVEAVVDNGGDIAFLIGRPMAVGIYAGASQVRGLAFEVEPRPVPFGICTSSGTVGPSFSYGRADAAVVVSRNIVLADAAATALGNRVKTEEDLDTCFDFMESLPEVEGALAIMGERIALWGKLPRLVKAEVDPEIITKGKKKWNADLRRGSGGLPRIKM